MHSQDKETKIHYGPKLIILAFLILAILIYLFVPPVNAFMNSVFEKFTSGNFDEVRNFIGHYGAQAAFISFILMILQSLIAPIPAFVITIANANLFGWWQGAILSWVSSMVGASLCFLIAR
ncbi:MAG: TVP38/TMEM64 family protein, partial [Coriobacteriia bacterium]|nr:TVP38/TMEM64 family protein [Coriobacteriia bacterium]